MSEKAQKHTPEKGLRRERFVKVAESRVNRVLENLESLGKCSNKRNYEYSDDDMKRIFTEIEKKTKEVKGLFQETTKDKRRFSLES